MGLAIGAVLIAGLQARPISYFPSEGTLQLKITDGVPVAELSIQAPSKDSCHPECNATSITLTITSIEVHTSGIDNMTGAWTPICAGQFPMTVKLTQLPSLVENLCGATFAPNTITNVRFAVSSGTTTLSDGSIALLTVPSGKLETSLSPLAEIQAGKTTTIIFEPHIVCPGNGNGCKITPGLHAEITGPE